MQYAEFDYNYMITFYSTKSILGGKIQLL